MCEPSVPVVRPRVREKFYRGKHVRTGGSGIGLAVVATLVQAHRGSAAVVDAESGGACFSIRFPIGTQDG